MAERTSLEKDSEKIMDNKDTNKTETTADEAARIRAEIEGTRHEMGETIDAIQDRLSVENISEQVSEEISERATNLYETAKHTVYDSTVGKAQGFLQNAVGEIKNSSILEKISDSNILEDIKKSKILDKAAANPLPVFFIAMGAGFLLSRSRGKKRVSKYNDYQQFGQSSDRRANDYSPKSSTFENAKDTIGNKANAVYKKASDTANSAYDKTSNAASSVYDKAGNVVSGTYETAENAAKSAYQNAGDAADFTMKKAGELSETAREQYDYYIEESPLIIGAVALAAGALVGLAIPSTSYENELVGKKRDQLLAHAKNSAKDTIEQVKQVAGQAATAASEEVKEKISANKKSA